ncbi:hypothetical protein BDP27DRAFT_1065990 [Rhodocollybia butyracea]|uniref:Phenylalanine ammonia-lyase n=1 Tax=Rhodocollybia butyracea TaxID=206335 RepID=A0A9P5P3R5_9AGAR|nr:hypothetical protein BDP27DRAFT_1065990 [Rhodocollybia butyracea]
MSLNHTGVTRHLIGKVNAYISGGDSVLIDGNSLDIAGVIAVSRRGSVPKLSDNKEVFLRVNRATIAVQDRLSEGSSLYGVTTGVGASAFTRTNKVEELQRALTKNLNGILPITSTSVDMQMVLDGNYEGYCDGALE